MSHGSMPERSSTRAWADRYRLRAAGGSISTVAITWPSSAASSLPWL